MRNVQYSQACFLQSSKLLFINLEGCLQTPHPPDLLDYSIWNWLKSELCSFYDMLHVLLNVAAFGFYLVTTSPVPYNSKIRLNQAHSFNLYSDI